MLVFMIVLWMQMILHDITHLYRHLVIGLVQFVGILTTGDLIMRFEGDYGHFD